MTKRYIHIYIRHSTPIYLRYIKGICNTFPQQITQVLQHVVCYLIISVLHDERMKVEIYFYDMLITYLCLGDLTGQGIKQSDNEVIQY